ncbi:hypothetical protein RBG61_13080 [Paludicola sp. MB14-C6]|uniref:hypothetical protein n=1 Tax=Paludihabitans sp. MB14-C6 TaxID=3070656 RepID=UPI0027DBC91F|nr:hypothetical protein [Paludicola sp. MB14-C6]WMJ22907.1 hypothetical protein RBG61_13080 [Paludicola sp. MB14-C6]
MSNNLSTNEVNKLLKSIYEKWYETVFIKTVCYNNANYSNPLYIKCTEAYAKAKNKVMIIGQETHGTWFKDLAKDNDIEILQNLYHNYLTNDYASNASPFWKFANEFRMENEFNIIWNNITKVNFCNSESCKIEQDIADKLNSDFNSLTLLEHELTVLKPDYVILLCGPYYSESIATALNLSNTKLVAPNSNQQITEINPLTINQRIQTSIKKLLWTYHPNALSRNQYLENPYTISQLIKKEMGL